MVKVPIHGEERYLDGYLRDNMELIQQAVKKKWDGVLYVGGYEGDGKSVFTEQLAAFVDPTYNIDRCVFNPEQFIKAVNEAEQEQAIVYDEAQDAFESTNRDSLTKAVKSLMTRIRKKQLYIFIVAPDFWRINKYLFIHRSRAFMRIYSNGLERGYFEYYNRAKKHQLMILGKRTENINLVKPNFRGRFTKWRVLDELEYDKKKDEATSKIQEDKNKIDPLKEKKLQREYTIKTMEYLQRNNWLKHGAVKGIVDFLGISDKTYYNYREKLLNTGDGGEKGLLDGRMLQ